MQQQDPLNKRGQAPGAPALHACSGARAAPRPALRAASHGMQPLDPPPASLRGEGSDVDDLEAAVEDSLHRLRALTRVRRS